MLSSLFHTLLTTDRPVVVEVVVGLLTALLVFCAIHLFLRVSSTPGGPHTLFHRLFLVPKPDSVYEMDALSDTPQGEPYLFGPEKRGAFRRHSSAVRILVKTPEIRAEPMKAWVVDRSTTGLGIVTGKEFPEGVVLAVRPKTAPSSAPWVEVQVRSCRPHGKGWRSGCQFLSKVEWGVLLMFG